MARCVDVDKLLEYLEKEAESEDVKYSFIGAGVQATISVIKKFPLECEHTNYGYDNPGNYCPNCGAKMDEEQ